MTPSLEQLLSITPFTSLVPTQDLAGLLLPGFKSACPSVTNPQDRVLHDEINAHPDQYAYVLDHIERQFAEFSDPQLDDIDFKQPLHIAAPLLLRLEAHCDPAAAAMVHSPEIVAQRAQMGAIEARIDSAVLAPLRKQRFHGPTHSLAAVQPRLLPARDSISAHDGDTIIHSTSYLLRSDMQRATLLTMELLMERLNEPNSAAWADHDKDVVSAAWLVKVHDCLLRLDQLSAFAQINLEELRTLQQTCFRCLTECIEQHAWHDDDPMGLMMAAVVACKCMLLVMANRSDRGLFVDEYLTAIIDVNYNVVENMVAETRESTRSANIGPVVACVCDILTLLGQFSTNGHVDEYILTRLEYLATYAIFLPALTLTSKHKSALSTNTMETLRWNSSQLLTTIFRFHPKQRPFILRDVLDSFSKVSKLTFKTFRGVSVSVTTVVLLNLVQSVDMSRAYLVAANVGASDHSTLLGLGEELLYLLRQSEQVCGDITLILLNKLNNSQLEGHVRPRFESLVLDLIDLLPFPEWSVAEVLLNAIMTRLVEVTEELKSADAFILDIMGNIGIHIVPSTTQIPADYHSRLLDLLRFVQLQAKRNRFYHAGRDFLVLKLAANGGTSNDLSTLKSLASVMTGEKLHCQSSDDIDSVPTYAPLLQSCRLYLQYQRFIKVVVQSINSTKVKTRSKAMRIISSLSEVDPNLILSIQLSISGKLSDSSPMVRDTVLELIAHILKPELVPKFYQPVCDRLNDSSVQVRRRLVKLCEDLYGMTSDIKVLTHISVRMLRKLNDEEETVGARVWDSMVKLWFGMDLNLPQSTKVMMEIASSTKTQAHLLQEFVLRATFEMTGALKRIVDGLFEHLYKKDSDNKDQVVKALQLLCLIADNSQGSMISQDQLIALRPLILDEERSGEACYYVLKVFNVALKDMGLLRRSFLASMETIMLKRLTRFSVTELDEAMPCIWQLCTMSGNTVKLANASVSCIRHVRPYIGQLKGHGAVDSSEVPKLRKLLNLLGAFGKYGRFAPHREVYQMANIGLKDSESIVSLIAKILLFFCSKLGGASDLKRIAIGNMMGICASHPNLFVSETMIAVLDYELQQGDDIDTKLVIIEGLIQYLEKEEARLQRRQAVEEHHKRVNLEVQSRSNVNDNISASTIQRYTRFILPLCLHDDGTRSNRFLAFTPVRYLQLVIALGFANPKTCISTVIALESTTNAYVKQIAMGMHRDLFEKHESLVDTSYLEAIKLAVAFRLRCHGSIVKERFFFKDIYSIVSYSRASRRKFTQSLCKTLVVGPKNVSEQKALVVYSVLNISTMSFVASEDVYMIVHHLDLVIMNQGLDILEKISSRGNTEVTLASLVVVQIYIALMSLRQFLCLMYGILANQLDDYRPTGKVDADLKQPPRCVRLDDFVFDSSVVEEDLESSDAQIRILGSFVERIKQITG